MKLIYQEKIQHALSAVQPHSVAVDFIGLDWQSYLDIATVQQIIVSPTMGSDPAAIEQVAAMIEGEWNGVHFLDQLHTKLYIGTHFVAMGNFNLVKNNLPEDRLKQVGIVSEKAQFREDAETLFGNLKRQAQQDYPDTASKLKKLAQLRAATDSSSV